MLVAVALVLGGVGAWWVLEGVLLVIWGLAGLLRRHPRL